MYRASLHLPPGPIMQQQSLLSHGGCSCSRSRVNDTSGKELLIDDAPSPGRAWCGQTESCSALQGPHHGGRLPYQAELVSPTPRHDWTGWQSTRPRAAAQARGRDSATPCFSVAPHEGGRLSRNERLHHRMKVRQHHPHYTRLTHGRIGLLYSPPCTATTEWAVLAARHKL